MAKILPLHPNANSDPASRSDQQWLDILSRQPKHVLESGLLLLTDGERAKPLRITRSKTRPRR